MREKYERKKRWPFGKAPASETEKHICGRSSAQEGHRQRCTTLPEPLQWHMVLRGVLRGHVGGSVSCDGFLYGAGAEAGALGKICPWAGKPQTAVYTRKVNKDGALGIWYRGSKPQRCIPTFQQVLNPTPLSPTPATCHKGSFGKLRCRSCTATFGFL